MRYQDLSLAVELTKQEMNTRTGGNHLFKNYGHFVVFKAHYHEELLNDGHGLRHDENVEAVLLRTGMTFGESASSPMIHDRKEHNNPGEGVGPSWDP